MSYENVFAGRAPPVARFRRVGTDQHEPIAAVQPRSGPPALTRRARAPLCQTQTSAAGRECGAHEVDDDPDPVADLLADGHPGRAPGDEVLGSCSRSGCSGARQRAIGRAAPPGPALPGGIQADDTSGTSAGEPVVRGDPHARRAVLAHGPARQLDGVVLVGHHAQQTPVDRMLRRISTAAERRPAGSTTRRFWHGTSSPARAAGTARSAQYL
jgi:hypothetical protein